MTPIERMKMDVNNLWKTRLIDNFMIGEPSNMPRKKDCSELDQGKRNIRKETSW